MTDIQEAIARIRIAEFEARQKEDRIWLWKRGFSLVLRGVVVAVGLFCFTTNEFELSGAHALGLMLMYFAIPTWENRNTDRRLQALETEIERLKDRLAAQSS